MAGGSKKLPAFQFYPGDWRKDPGVQALDFHDRGVWFEMLCLMHESDERGVLLLNGRPMSDRALARLMGLDEESMSKSVETLLDYGVASRRESDGALVCRRMVRDEEKRRVAKQNGHDGGNPKLKGGYNKPGFVYAIRRESDGAVKIGIAVNVQNRFRKIKYGDKGDEFTLMGQMAVPDMGSAEERLHKEHQEHRVVGEWFNLPANKLENLLALMGNPKGTGGADQRASSSLSTSSSTSVDKTPYSPPRGTGGESRSDTAERIYQAYPRKVGKAKAIKAITLALRRDGPDAITADDLLAAVQEFARAVEGADPQFIPHPATWFNAGRWTDDRDDWRRIGRERGQPATTHHDFGGIQGFLNEA